MKTRNSRRNSCRAVVSNLPPNIRVGIVNVSVAGCKIELFQKDSFQTYASTAPNWMTNIINAYGRNPYQRLVATAENAFFAGLQERRSQVKT